MHMYMHSTSHFVQYTQLKSRVVGSQIYLLHVPIHIAVLPLKQEFNITYTTIIVLNDQVSTFDNLKYVLTKSFLIFADRRM